MYLNYTNCARSETAVRGLSCLSSLDKILKSISGKHILVVGDVMLDNYIWGDTSRISPEAPVPVVNVSKETYTAGGAANVALNIASLGGHTSLFGWIGQDSNGSKLVEIMDNKNINILDEAICPNHHTIVKTRVICRRQQLCRLDYEPPPETFNLSAEIINRVIAPVAEQTDAVIISDYAKGVVTTDSIKAIQSAAPASTIIAIDPKPGCGTSYKNINIMTPNRSEACELAGIDNSQGEATEELFCKRIYEKFAPEYLIVTLGADGMLVSKSGKIVDKIPTVAREVFDVSGAGDTVISALTLAVSAGVTIEEAVRFANTAAGFVVGKIGTAAATPEDLYQYVSETV